MRKLLVDTPEYVTPEYVTSEYVTSEYVLESDATIVAPLMFALILGE